MGHVTTVNESSGLSRREALRKGALLAGVAWTVPVVQVLSVDPAHAAVASPGSPPPQAQPGDGGVGGTGEGFLPRTGGAQIGAVVAGATLVAGGVAVRAAARSRPAASTAVERTASPGDGDRQAPQA